jgi:hypothetical protein
MMEAAGTSETSTDNAVQHFHVLMFNFHHPAFASGVQVSSLRFASNGKVLMTSFCSANGQSGDRDAILKPWAKIYASVFVST